MRLFSAFIFSAILAGYSVAATTADNTLSPAEKKTGWTLLFDGKTMHGWIDPRTLSPAGDSWSIEDGCLKANPQPRINEDLVSKGTYRNFELQWDWRISAKGNSGLKYRIQDFILMTKGTLQPGTHKFEDQAAYAMRQQKKLNRKLIQPGQSAQIYVIGFEYQMIDNNGHPDAKHGKAYQTAALYSIVGPSEEAVKPVGEFNHSLLIVRGNHVEHWLNGVKVVDTTLDNDQLKANLAKRWGIDSPIYHDMVEQPRKDCPISLQNHHDAAWFRNIKIRRLP